MRIVMLGTGEFALPTFRAVCDSPHEVVGLFTQPDRKGRGHHQHPHPMKEAALEKEIPVFQPENINTPESLDELRALSADLFLVAAYGQILKRELLSIPPYGAINIHASLLPKYRGAAPIQYALREGDKKTGITLFQIEPKLDAGPILGREETDIDPEETAGELHDRLAELSIDVTLRVLDEIKAGKTQSLPQEGEVTLAPRLKKEEGIIDWSRSAWQIHNLVRGMNPWPKAWSWIVQPDHPPLRVIFLKTRVTSESSFDEPGTVISTDQERLQVATSSGVLELIEVQPEGKRAMSAADFLHGHAISPGIRFENA